ncbi:MAG TPA: hypothetical protein VGD67_12025 [Pseudonocardiaceae bacterium]
MSQPHLPDAPSAPPRTRNGLLYLVGAVALVAVAGLVAAVIVLLQRGDETPPTAPAAGATQLVTVKVAVDSGLGGPTGQHTCYKDDTVTSCDFPRTTDIVNEVEIEVPAGTIVRVEGAAKTMVGCSISDATGRLTLDKQRTTAGLDQPATVACSAPAQ